MTSSNNPTAVSATLGQRFSLGTGRGVGARLKNLTMPAILVAFATYLLVGIFTMTVPEGTAFPGPQFFPALIVVGLYACAALQAVAVLRAPDPQGEPGDEDEQEEQKSVRLDVASLAWVIGSFLAFALLLGVLGWVIAAALLFFGVARGFGSVGWLRSLVVGLTVSSITYIAFDMLLGLSLPSGVLGWGF